MRKITATAGSAVFLVIAPGVVAGLVPWWLTGWHTGAGYPAPARITGAALTAAGAAALLAAFAQFALQGQGTPAPPAPTAHLVIRGLYRYVRNPMYLAVLAVITGQALLLSRPVLLGYAAVVAAAFIAFVYGYEQPTLARRYGVQYQAYRQAVPGWWPRLLPVRKSAAPGSPWQHEPAVRAALREHWGLPGELRPMQARAASRTWQVGGHVVKLARDEPAHFTAGLRASEAAERAGIATGAPVRTRAGELCVALPPGRESWVLSVLHRVDGRQLSMQAVAPAVLGEFLGRLHHILRGCPTAGAWMPGDVLGHMTRGVTAAHPPAARQMITQAISGVRAYYATMPPVQLLYGDGPGIFSANGADISAIIDWGGVRTGSVADDIGCWTAHGATDQIPLPVYTVAFLRGYRHSNDLSAADAAAIPLFQRLRIASRACYITDPDALADVEAWMRRAFGE